jgi:CxxC motif-containing protein (DUF1111 family)
MSLPILVAACGQTNDDTAATESFALGDALPGVNGTTFATAKANFGAVESQQDGLGPIFNQNGCGTCHQNGALGGAGQQIEKRYGRIANGVFDPMASTGGSLRQLFGIGGYNVTVNGQNVNCNANADANPAPGATVFANRLTTPTFGAGLVELIPDSTIQGIAAAQPAAIRGTAVMNTIQLTSGPFTRGQQHVARFGWKAVHASVADFAADAYLNEMGITTIHCNGTAPITDFATENRTDRAATNAVINGCPDDKLPGTDDFAGNFNASTNSCSGTDVQDDVANFAFFMRALAAPPRGSDSSNGRGLTEFNREGCNGCHVTTTFTVTINGRSVSFQPFSDFLVHDMGSLGDGIGNAGDSGATLRQMRTAPLWGLHNRNMMLHIGTSSDRAGAIRAHAGQGAAAAAAFNSASSSQQNDLLNFLGSL